MKSLYRMHKVRLTSLREILGVAFRDILQGIEPLADERQARIDAGTKVPPSLVKAIEALRDVRGDLMLLRGQVDLVEQDLVAVTRRERRLRKQLAKLKPQSDK